VNTPNGPSAKKAHVYAEGKAEELGREAWAELKAVIAQLSGMRKAWARGFDAARKESERA
jgi:hypothetical protein